MRTALQLTIFALAAIVIIPNSWGQNRERPGDGEAKAHWQQQHQENEAFRQTLRGLEPTEALAKIKAHRILQHRENLQFFSEQKDRQIARVNGRERLPDDKKAELISLIEVMYARKVAFVNGLHRETIQLINQLAANPDVTLKEILESFKAHMTECKGKIEAFREAQAQEWRTKLREILGERPARRVAE